jgi:Holliday junction resolvase RusA-like endonuclease
MLDQDRYVWVLKFPGTIPSVNKHLVPIVIKKKYWSRSEQKFKYKYTPNMMKSPEASSYQQYILKELRRMEILDDKITMRKWKWFKVRVEVIFNHSYEQRDTDNIIKLTQDVIFNQFLKIDDSRINSVTSEKYEDKSNANEFLVISFYKNTDIRDKFKRG